MSADEIVALATSGLAFLASIIAVIVSAYNARFARFASEKWWERKAEAYTRISGALSDLVYYYGQTYETQFSNLSEERQREIDEHWRKGHLEVRKATDIGAFAISREAEEALKEYWKRPAENIHPEDWSAHLEIDYMSAEKCLKKLVACARKDLRV